MLNVVGIDSTLPVIVEIKEFAPSPIAVATDIDIADDEAETAEV